MKKFLPLLLLLSIAIQTTAQAPQAFTYQAVARDMNGNPVINQEIAIKISILFGSPDGTVLYSEIHQITTTSLGLINLEIGNGTVVSGSFQAIAWGNNASFIKTEMDTSGGDNFVFLGTSQLLSVPYSLFSDNGVPDGQNPGDMLYWDGSQWIEVGAGQNGQFLIFSNGVPTWGGVHLPILITSAVTNITAFTAYSGGNIASDGGSPIVGRGICWNTSPNPTTGNFKVFAGSGAGNFLAQMTGLESSTQYFVRAFATNSAGTSYGQEISFYTNNGNITLTTTSITNITINSAMSGGNITSNGGSSVTMRGVCWSTAQYPTISDNKTTDGSGNGTFESQLTGLTNNTQYYLRAYATNSVGTSYGNQIMFTTLSGIVTITTAQVTGITSNSAISGGEITSDGGSAVTVRGVCWSTSQNPTIAHNKTTDGTGNGIFVSQPAGLANNTTYYVRAYATNSIGTSYGNQLTFTTLSGIVTLTTAEVTAITDNSATCGGEITSDGGSVVTSRGVCWNISSNPTIANSLTTDGEGTGTFVSALTELLEDTTYYVRVYATNAVGTYYGNEVSFETWDNLPTFAPNSPQPEDGSADVPINQILSWYCSDPENDPVTYDIFFGTENQPIQVATAIADTFYTSGILNYNTTYYWKIVAHDDNGNSTEGEVWSFTTRSEEWLCGDVLIDERDGQEYNTVQIDEQCWMAENLNIGTRINGISNQTNNGTIEKYCYSNSDAQCNVYGGLYQWNEMMGYTTTAGIQGICPTGWHLPMENEFTALSTYLGGEDIAGGKMKETGTIHWASPNTGATNSSGFTSLPSGYRYTNGSFLYLGTVVGFWNSTETSSTSAWNRELYYNYAGIARYNDSKSYGFSVRCVRGENAPTNQAPYSPTNHSPENGSTGININSACSWSCSDPENDQLFYDVLFGTENPPALVATVIADTFYIPGSLNYNTIYYWKIVAHDDHGNSTEGEVWSFTTNQMQISPSNPINWTGDTGIILFQESNVVNSGNNSCGVIVNTASQAECDLINNSELDVNIGDNFKVSFWAITSSHVRATGALDWIGASSQYSGTYVGPSTLGWHQFSFSGNVPSGATAVKLRIRFYDVSGFAPGEIQYIDNVEFESPIGTLKVLTNGGFEIWPILKPEPSNYPTAFNATALGLVGNLNWIDAIGEILPDAYLIKISDQNNIADPIDGVYEMDELNLVDGNGIVNIVQGQQGFTFTGLTSQSLYFLKIYPYTNSGMNINYKTDGTIPFTQIQTGNIITLLSETFNESWGGWETVSVIGDQVWSRDNTYGIGATPCAQMSGFASGNYFENEDWLISPAMNFDEYSNELFTFYSACGYPVTPHLIQVKISNEYVSGDPNNVNWIDLNPIFPSGNPNYVFTNSGTLAVSAMTGTNVRVAFIYISDNMDSETWEIENVEINGEVLK